MPGTILESRELDAGLVYSANFNDLSIDVPNLDVPLADLITISLFIEATDKQGQKVYIGRVINLHGPEVFSLDAPPVDPLAIFDNSFE